MPLVGQPMYLGVSRHSVLRWSTDLQAFTLQSEAGSCAQRVLHLYSGRGLLTNVGHQLDGGHGSWWRGFEDNVVEQVLTRCHIMKCHLRRQAEG